MASQCFFILNEKAVCPDLKQALIIQGCGSSEKAEVPCEAPQILAPPDQFAELRCQLHKQNKAKILKNGKTKCRKSRRIL